MEREIGEAEKIITEYKKYLVKPNPNWPLHIQQALTCINKNLLNFHITIGWVKNECHIHNKSFSAQFSFYVGMLPKSYLLNHRILIGKQLLKKTDLPITIIAFHLGFQSLSAFSNTFKAKVGVQPSEWKKKHT